MRAEFNNLVETLKRWDLYQIGDEVDMALTDLSDKIAEVEKRMECVDRTANEIRLAISNYTEKVDEPEPFIMTVANHDSILRGANDILVAIDFEDDEPIENNWYGLFEVKEEPKVLIPKGSIVEWGETIKFFSAIGGAKAIVLEDYTTEHESNDKCINVEWLDDKANGQSNGGYHLDMFKEEFDKPMKIIDTTMGKDMVEDIIQKLIQLDVDGETMQYIIDQVGMTDQMLRQLVMNTPTSETIDLLEEKRMISDEHLTQK
jgi:hypothetical protein